MWAVRVGDAGGVPSPQAARRSSRRGRDIALKLLRESGGGSGGLPPLFFSPAGAGGGGRATRRLAAIGHAARQPANSSHREAPEGGLMTFGHTLPRRLVALVATTVAVTLAVQSCELPRSVDTGTATPVAQVVVTPPSGTTPVGQTVQLTATPEDAAGNALSGRAVIWSSSQSSVAGVDANGLVTALATGSATITATSEGKSGSASITVITVPVASVSVSPAAASVLVGATVQLVATPKDANGTPLSGRAESLAYKHTSGATVTRKGLWAGAAGGTATTTGAGPGQERGPAA